MPPRLSKPMRDAPPVTLAPPPELDLARMRRERHARLVGAMQDADIDTLLLLGQGNVAYATGTRVPAADQARALHRRPVALVTADGAPPHVWTSFPETAPPDLPAGHLHDAVQLELDDGVRTLLADVPSGAVAVDELTMPLHTALLADGRTILDPVGALGAAKVRKTPDELSCIRHAQAINEAAIAEVRASARSGTRARRVTGRFLRAVHELGAHGNTVDPVWQQMPPSIAEGPFSVTGDVVFPTVTGAGWFTRGAVVWVDTGISYEGYQSDYGHTWVIDEDPSPRRRAQAARWREVVGAARTAVRPGATARDLTRAAGMVDGRRPWLPHLYLAHGTGTESAEAPFVGTDLGDAFDESVVLAPGMVLVFEPVIWDDGHAGFRAEEIVAVTEDGHDVLSTLTWDGWE